MQALTTEVLLIETSDAFRKDPTIAIPAIQIALQAEGAHAPAYYGKQIGSEEEPSTWGYFIVDWDEYSCHKALMDGPRYGDLLAAFKGSIGGKIIMYHVKFSAMPIGLKQPVSEISIFALKEPGKRAAVEKLLAELSEASGKVVVFGQTREDENKYIAIGGWPSIEAHKEAAAQPQVTAALENLATLTTQEHLCYTELLQYRL